MGWSVEHPSVFNVGSTPSFGLHGQNEVCPCQPLIVCHFPGGIQLPALVDTGSMKSILSQEAFQQIMEQNPPTAMVTPLDRSISNPCVSITGQSLNTLGSSVIQLSLPNTTNCYEGKFLICNNVLQPLQCILGWDFFVANQLEISYSGNCYHLVGPQGTTPLSLLPHSSQQCASTASTLPVFTQSLAQGPVNVVLTTAISVPARTECIVQGKVAKSCSDKLGMISTLAQSSDVPYTIAYSVSKADRRSVPVRIMNSSSSPIELYSGQKVAKFCPLAELVSGATHLPNSISCSVRNQNGKVSQVNSELQAAVNPKLSRGDKEKLLQTLLDFSDIFQDHLGHTAVLEHHINTGNSPPIRQSPRRLPYHFRGEVSKQIQDMLSQGVIQPSTSPWASPLVLVKKKDGSYRFCVDYRKLNQVTKQDSQPLPRVDDLLDALNGYKIFSTLDLRSGYWQVGMNPQDMEKTAFIAPDGLFEFKRMPFGLSTAPATFSRAISIILSGLTFESCLCYFDDVLIYSKDIDQHCERLTSVLQRFRQHGLKVKASKCSFGADQVLYLGHTISNEGVHTDPAKIEAVQNLPAPTNVEKLRSFLGLAGYYRRFIPHFSSVAAPLTKLTEKSVQFKWDALQHESFSTLKRSLCEAPILAYPDFDRPFILQTDASNVGLGAVLAQVDHTGCERVIAYASCTLSKRERNYSAMEKEALAIVFAVKHFRFYLLGRSFCIVTDNSALRWLHSMEPKGRIARWIMDLQEFEFTVKHRSGDCNSNADALSRLNHDTIPPEVCSADISCPDVSCFVTVSPDANLVDAQHKDPELLKIIELKTQGFPKPPSFVCKGNPTLQSLFSCWDQLYVNDGLLLRAVKAHSKLSRNVVVVPQSLVTLVIQNLHSSPSGGHMGITRTLYRARERFFWPKMQETIQSFVTRCPTCNRNKSDSKQGKAPLQPINISEPFLFWAMDYMGPISETARGNRHILVMMDHFTKWCEAFPTRDQRASTVASILVSRVFSRFGPPTFLHSDQGRNFDSNLMHEIYELMGIKKTRTTAYHPQSDGLVERQNRTLQDILSTFVVEHQTDWDEMLDQAVFAYNTSVHESTKLSPYEMVFGRPARMPIEVELGIPVRSPSSQSDYSRSLRKAIHYVNEIARRHLETARKQQCRQYDSKNSREWKPFESGQMVWLWRPKKGKFATRWGGPYQILSREGVNYTILSNEGKRLVTHHNQLKVCHTPPGKGQPIHPVPETPGIILQEEQPTLPQDRTNRDREFRGPRPAHLRQLVNPPIRFGDVVSH